MALGGEPTGQFSDVARDIRRLLGKPLPDYATADPEAIRRWTIDAAGAMDERAKCCTPSKWLHAVYVKVETAGVWEPVARHIRSGERNVIAQAAEDHAHRIGALADDGRKHYTGLLRQVREGIFIRRPLHEGQGAFLAVKGSDDEPERPTETEMVAWIQKYGDELGLSRQNVAEPRPHEPDF